MKKVKNIILIIILVFILVLLWQNQAYLLTKTYIQLNLGINMLNFISPEINNLILLIVCFCIGFCISYIPSKLRQYKHNKKVKELNEVISEKDIKINELQGNLLIENSQNNKSDSVTSDEDIKTEEVASNAEEEIKPENDGIENSGNEPTDKTN